MLLTILTTSLLERSIAAMASVISFMLAKPSLALTWDSLAKALA